MKRIAIVALSGLLLADATLATSFDCSKATSKVEKLICDNKGLSRLDDDLDATYKALLQDSTQGESIKHQQRIWLKGRNDCPDVTCIKNSYLTQLALLKATPNLEYDGKRNTRSYVSDPSAMERNVFEHENVEQVCGLFLENLQYFASRKLPMSCGQPIAPPLTGKVEGVEWEDIDPDKHLDLLQEVAAYKHAPDSKVVAFSEKIRRNEYVFRRAKFTLVGHPTDNDLSLSQWAKSYVTRYRGHAIPGLKLTIVQYGPNINSPDNPDNGLRCNTKQIRGGTYPYSKPGFVLVTDDLRHVYGDVTQITGYMPTYLWRIDGRVYGEGAEGGDIELLEFGGVMETNADPFFFEPVCLYHYVGDSKQPASK